MYKYVYICIYIYRVHLFSAHSANGVSFVFGFVALRNIILTVDERISWGQQASKKLLQTFESEYFT